LSDLQGPVPFEETEQYKKYYQPQNIYYGLYLTIVYNDCPLGLLALLRSKSEPEFNDREIFYMELLKIHLALKLYTLLVEPPDPQINILPAENNNPFNLTKREIEIIHHICNGETDDEISNLLYISRGTLRRHVYNIYRKTNIMSRIQLIKKFA
jgi:DNA-binding CsgD family transcriptional regulator